MLCSMIELVCKLSLGFSLFFFFLFWLWINGLALA